MPKVSVIVPVYGVEKYIERCARSLFEQTLDDIEYLFIDDCTPDKSVEILRSVMEDYPQRKGQVVIHRMEKNSGQAVVRKWGIQHATGEYVIHCDSDDWVDREMYRLLYEKAIAGGLDIVVCDYYDTDGVNITEVKQSFSKDKKDMMFSYFTLWCKIVKRSLFENHEINYPKGNMGEDRVYSLQLAWYAESYGYVERPLYYYYTNPASIVHTIDKEKSISIFQQRKKNTDIICSFIVSNNIGGCKTQLTMLKLLTLVWLYPFLKDNKIYKMWKEAYPELVKDCICAFNTNKRECLRYYLVYFRLYQIFK